MNRRAVNPGPLALVWREKEAPGHQRFPFDLLDVLLLKSEPEAHMAKKPYGYRHAERTHRQHEKELVDPEHWLLAFGRIVQAYVDQYPHDFRFTNLRVRGKRTLKVSPVGWRNVGTRQ